MPTFAELCQAFLDEELADSPVFATQLGVEGYDDQLDDLSAAAFEERVTRAQRWVRTFEDVSPASLSLDEGIDRDLLLSVLRGQLVMADWEMWRRQPDTYLNPGLGGIFLLFLRRLHPERDLARSALARLRRFPDNIADGKRNLIASLTPRVYVQRAMGQAQAGARYLREILPGEVSDPALRLEIAEAGAQAATHLEDYVEFLEKLAPKATGEWAIGEERYSRLLREKELLETDARDLRERGRREYDRLAKELRRYAQQIASTDDWPAVLLSFNADHPATPQDMRETYEQWTARARRFLREKRLVSFPEGEECLVEPSPHFQRPVLAVASYQSPPPFSDSMIGHFFVPYPPDGASEAEVQKRLEGNSYAAIPTTAVHEAYPGHHWQLSLAKLHPSPVRRSFRTPYFSEGWALYAEQVMREQGFFTDPRHEMSQVEATIFRAARIVVDTSLHLGEMSYDDAVRFMMEKANQPEPTARAEVTRYCAWPTQASAYLTGCLEILRIRDRFLREKQVDGVEGLRAFHDRIAGSGGLPIALAERAALA